METKDYPVFGLNSSVLIHELFIFLPVHKLRLKFLGYTLLIFALSSEENKQIT